MRWFPGLLVLSRGVTKPLPFDGYDNQINNTQEFQ